MRVFKSYNDCGDDVCPVCGKNTQKKTVLIPIAGTEKGNIMKAIQVHLDCIDLTCLTQGNKMTFIQIVKE
jgi:RNA polymerase subunit RPABC4/transcription elongation factor Spt4